MLGCFISNPDDPNILQADPEGSHQTAGMQSLIMAILQFFFSFFLFCDTAQKEMDMILFYFLSHQWYKSTGIASENDSIQKN